MWDLCYSFSNMIYFGESSLGYWEECVPQLLSRIFCRCLWSIMQFNSEVSLLIFFLIWKTYFLMRVGVLVTHFYCIWTPFCPVVFILGSWVHQCSIHSYLWLLYLLDVLFCLLICSDQFYLEVCFVRYEYSDSCFLTDCVCLEYNFPPFHFQSICVFASETSFLYTVNS
jgi:hypothetical protein